MPQIGLRFTAKHPYTSKQLLLQRTLVRHRLAHSQLPPDQKQAGTTGRRLRGALLHRLGTAITSGEFAPGSFLPTEAKAALELKVSRSAFREAVQQLTAKGLVESRPSIGTRVLPQDRWNLLDPEVLAWTFAGEPDERFVRGLFELRAIIEPAAAAIAAERCSREDVKAMRDALARMARFSVATEAGRAGDRDFHQAILNATKNPALIVLSASISAAVTWTTVFKQSKDALPRDAIPDHRLVLDAIAAKDVNGARQAMRSLVDLALDDITQSMPGRSEGSKIEIARAVT